MAIRKSKRKYRRKSRRKSMNNNTFTSLDKFKKKNADLRKRSRARRATRARRQWEAEMWQQEGRRRPPTAAVPPHIRLLRQQAYANWHRLPRDHFIGYQFPPIGGGDYDSGEEGVLPIPVPVPVQNRKRPKSARKNAFNKKRKSRRKSKRRKSRRKSKRRKSKRKSRRRKSKYNMKNMKKHVKNF